MAQTQKKLLFLKLEVSFRSMKDSCAGRKSKVIRHKVRRWVLQHV